MMLGKGLPYDKCTSFYKLIRFCTDKLHRSYSEYLKLPMWERNMLAIYLEIEDEKEIDRQGKLEEEQEVKGYK